MDAELRKSERNGLVFDLRLFSVNDGPGIRSTVFFQGCPLSCSWCHNPEGRPAEARVVHLPEHCRAAEHACTVYCRRGFIELTSGMPEILPGCDGCRECLESCPFGALSGGARAYGREELLAILERDRPFYEQSGGGVTCSGGEPFMQADFLLEFLAACRGRGLHTVVDTCGYTDWSKLEAAVEFTDLFLYDLKLMDEELHQHHTGVSNRLILDNLERLLEAGARVTIRVPVIPGLTDQPQNLEAMKDYLASLPPCAGLSLLPFHGSAAAKYRRLGLSWPFSSSMADAGLSCRQMAASLAGVCRQISIGE